MERVQMSKIHNGHRIGHQPEERPHHQYHEYTRALLKLHTVTIKTKLNLFKVYVQIIFLYNSELWTTTKTIADRNDSFQQKLVRQVMGVRWPKIVKNTELYEKTGVEKWSSIVKKRRLSWFGHVLRLNTSKESTCWIPS